LAKKKNRTAGEIDLTTFAWVNAGENLDKGTPGCGGCHPGGGGLEFDRDGRRYDRRADEDPFLAASLDGDYYRSRWADTGVIEADCFICHLPGYDYNARLRQLSRQNFQWAVISASGIGRVTGSVKENETIRITYNRRLFNEDGQIVVDLMSMPASENCVFCHGRADLLKRGFSWNDWENHDVHNMHGVGCVCCHQGNLDHNLAKGNENLSTVRDDLDDTMLKCRECHVKGYIGAPLPVHKNIRPNHLEKLSCEACHIPRLNRAAAQGLCVSSGKVITYPKGAARALGEEQTWKPDYHKGDDGRLEPVNRFAANLYTNRDADGIDYPLFARELGAAYARVRDQLDTDNLTAPLVRTPGQIQTMLAALEETLGEERRFQLIRPAYHFLGRRYFLDREDSLTAEPDHTWVAEEKGFNISHNVAPTRLALGANGCDDCHAQSSHMFESWIAGSTGGPGNGTPPAETAGLRLNSLGTYLRELHEHNHLKWVVGPAAFLFIFLSAVILYGKPIRISLGTARNLDAVAGLIVPLRRGALGLLAFTGYLFFYNNQPLLELIFHSMTIAVHFHMAAGLVFTLCSLPGFFRKTPRHRLEEVLILMLILSGALICFRERFGFEIRYGLAVVHASSALFFLSLRVARCYRTALLRKPEQGKKMTSQCNL
jgi:Cytochrome c554 and c-prime